MSSALTESQQDYLNGDEGVPSPFTGAYTSPFLGGFRFGDHLTALRNDILSTGFAAARNVETLAATKVLVIADSAIQVLDPDGSTRLVTLPAEALAVDRWFMVYNAAGALGELLTVRDDTPTNIRSLDAGEWGMFACDGTTWVLAGMGHVDFGALGIKMDAFTHSTTATGIDGALADNVANAFRLLEAATEFFAVSTANSAERVRVGKPLALTLAQNVETLTGAKVLVATDSQNQKLDPGGASRNVTLPAEATSSGLWYWIFNSADVLGELLTVRDDTPTTLVILDAGEGCLVKCNGTNWHSVLETYRDFAALGIKTDTIDESTAGAAISLVKALCLAEGTGVNLETLAGPKVLVIADAQFQVLDPDSAPRVLTLPAAKTGLFYWVFNTGGTLGETINVQKADTTSLRILNAGENALFVCAADWVFTGISRVDFGANGVKLDKIDESTTGVGVEITKALLLSGSGAFNSQALAGPLVLAKATSPHFQRLDPNGASRLVTLPAEATSDGLWFIVYNTADLMDELLTVQDDTPVTVLALNAREAGLFICDGTNWTGLRIGKTDFDILGLKTDIIDESTSARAISLIKALRLQGGGAWNVETLAAGKVLTVADPQFHRLDPDGAPRLVTLPAEATSDGLFYVIANGANALGELITVQDDTPAPIYVLDPREMAIFVCNGVNWVYVGRSLCDFGALGLETDAIDESTAGAAISLSKALCLAEGGGANQEVLAGTKTLVVTDAQFQRLDPDSANRNVVLPALKAGLWFRITNYGGTLGETLTVQNPTPATVRILDAGETGTFVSTAAAWFYLGGGLVDFGAPGIKADAIDESTAGAAISLSKAIRLREGAGVNTETLAGAKVLVNTDAQFQKLDPDGAPRDVTLPAVQEGLFYWIYDFGGTLGETLVVKNPAAATLATLNAGQSGLFVCTTASWVFAGPLLGTDFAAVAAALAAATGSVAFNTQKLTGVASGTAAGEAVQYSQLANQLDGSVGVIEGDYVGQPGAGNTFTITSGGAIVYEWDGVGANVNVAIGGDADTSYANLLAAIHGQAHNILFDVPAPGRIRIRTALTPGGAVTESDASVAVAHTTANLTMLGTNTNQTGRNLITRRQAWVRRVVDVLFAAGANGRVGELTWAPARILCVQVFTATGAPKYATDLFTITGNGVLWDSDGAVHIANTDEIRVLVEE